MLGYTRKQEMVQREKMVKKKEVEGCTFSGKMKG